MPVDTCQFIRRELAALGAKLGVLTAALGNAQLASERLELMEQIDTVLSQIDRQRALLEEFGCNIQPDVPPAPRPPTPPDPGLDVVAIETTQATQFLNLNGQGSGTGADNSVRLVAGKATLLRFYVNTPNPDGFSVSGGVSYHGYASRLYPVNEDPGQSPRYIMARTTDTIDRGNINHTLNFLVPASACVGSQLFSYEIYLGHHAGSPEYYRTGFFSLKFVEINRPRIRGVLVRYTGDDAAGNTTDIAAPSQADFINTLDFYSRHVFPIRGFRYTGFDAITDSGDFTDQSGAGCGTGWDGLLTTLSNMRSASNSTDIYVGMLPSGVPMGFTGCGSDTLTVAAGGVNDGPTMAQEIGHALQREHAPCGFPQLPPNPDPNYPAYASGGGSIGEFGFARIRNNPFFFVNPTLQIVPNTRPDFMSYCPNPWVSPYTYQGLMTTIGDVQLRTEAGQAEIRPVFREFLILNFSLHRDGRVTLQPSFHLPALSSNVARRGGGRQSPVACELLDEAGEVVFYHRCWQPDHHGGDEDAPHMTYREVIPWNDRVRAIRFLRKGAECHLEELPERPPRVRVQRLTTDGGERGRAKVEWTGITGTRDRPATQLLRYSHDGGETWTAIAANFSGSERVVDLDTLPGGERCKLQVVAAVGIRTATAETEFFAVAPKPMQAQITLPEAGATFRQGELLTLCGFAFSPDYGTVDPEDIVWSSHRDGVIGTGDEVTVQSLSVGRHKLTMSVLGEGGGEASASVTIAIEAGRP